MTTFEGIILGIVQGLTEFLPISSTGHLILAREALGLQVEYGLAFDAVLQLATALAVLVYFWKDFVRMFAALGTWAMRKPVDPSVRTLFLALILGTIPAVFFGPLLETYMETLFRSASLVSLALLFGSLIMWFAERHAKQDAHLNGQRGFWIGLFQSLALVPGMSRSGMSIAGGLILGLTREEATRFAFLLALPIIGGSGLKKLFELTAGETFSQTELPLLMGSLASFLVGIASIHFLIRYLRTHTLSVFIWYRIALALVVLILVL